MAHEALLRDWAPLREAILSAQDRLRLQAEFERDAREWVREGSRDGYLLRAERFARARQAAERSLRRLTLHLDLLAILWSASNRASEALEQTRASQRSSDGGAELSLGSALGIALLSVQRLSRSTGRTGKRGNERESRNGKPHSQTQIVS